MAQRHQELKTSSIMVGTGGAIKASQSESHARYKLSGPRGINGISAVTGGPYACAFGEDMCERTRTRTHAHAHTHTAPATVFQPSDTRLSSDASPFPPSSFIKYMVFYVCIVLNPPHPDLLRLNPITSTRLMALCPNKCSNSIVRYISCSCVRPPTSSVCLPSSSSLLYHLKSSGHH